MKVLVATKDTQGRRKTDFCWTEEGELVKFGFECDSDEKPDDRCGCRRSFSGMVSRKATTTAKVVERDHGREVLIEDVKRAMKKSYPNTFGEAELTRYATEEADELIQIANTFEVGDVLEKRGDTIQTREEKADG